MLDVAGEVEVTAKDGTRKARSGLVLAENATVTSRGGTAVLLFSDGSTQKVAAGRTVKVAGADGKAKESSTISRLLAAMAEITAGPRKTTAKGMVRAGEESEIQLVDPCNTQVLKEELRFKWEPSTEKGRLKIVIHTRDPRIEISFKAKDGTSSAELPSGTTALVPGRKYYWKGVRHDEDGNETGRSQLRWFALLSDEDSTRLKKDRAALEGIKGIRAEDRALLTATLLVSYGLFSDAAAALKKFADRAEHQDLLAAIEAKRSGE